MGRTKCEVCKKKCSGDILKADDKYFHIACFLCHTCRRPLSEVGYFERDGRYYCPGDYQAAFGVKCPACGQYAEGNVVQCAEWTYHQRCFKCTRCGKPFPNGEKVTFSGSNEHLCQRCVSVPVAMVRPTQQQAEPAAASPPPPPQVAALPQAAEPVEDLKAEQHQHKVEEAEPAKQQQQQPAGGPPVCAACEQLIHSGQVLLALDAQWHIWCFKCTACDSVLHGEYMAKDGRPYCIRDYNASYGVRCYECDKYIAGRVLQAGQYQFHPACATCARCAQPFADGEEMYMQGDEIWHARCTDLQPSDTVHAYRPARPASAGGSYQPKYSADFGKLLTYMYLLPEPEQGYLKHPIEPHPPAPEQFHLPKGPVKIRKSRISMLKTGMQRLAEKMEESVPRPRSPYMDNEEPIDLAHYPSGYAHNRDWVPPIERDDFPAPPYPYAVEDLKRRLSSSSIEDAGLDDEEDEADGGGIGGVGGGPNAGDRPSGAPHHAADSRQRSERQVGELRKLENESSIAHAIAADLEERAKKAKVPLHWDPRSASRTPNAKKIPVLRCRYDTPINASPSRYVNRPRPWERWTDTDRAATATLGFYNNATIPSRVVADKSATLPTGRLYYDTADGSTLIESSTIYTGGTATPAGTLPYTGGIDSGPRHSRAAAARLAGTLDIAHFQPNPGRAGFVPASQLRSSLPDMTKPPMIYSYDEIRIEPKKQLPDGADRCHLERHLAKDDFETTFNMTPLEFYKLPEWKRINLKRKTKLF